MLNGISSLTLIGLGAFFGALARYFLSKAVSAAFPSLFPYGTLLINLSGSFLLGWLIGSGANHALQLLLGTGFMGAFTTFSTFKLESLKLLQQRAVGVWLVYTICSYILGVSLALLGYFIAN
jgi:CrcB protein